MVITMPVMSKPKKQSGKHKTPRRTYHFPAEWSVLIRRIAASKKTHATWWMIELVQAEAEKLGFECPSPPWELGDDEVMPPAEHRTKKRS